LHRAADQNKRAPMQSAVSAKLARY